MPSMRVSERSALRAIAAGAVALLLSVTGADRVAGQAPAFTASGGASVIIPAETWSCGLPGGIPQPESGTLVFEARVPLGRVADVGQTPFGRRQVAITGEGTLTGARVTGSVMTGALDYQLILANGVIEIEQIFVFRTSDGRYIYARGAGTGPDASDVRIVMDFEAPNDSAVAWLNSGTYVARRVVDAGAKAMTVRVYDVSKAPPAAAGARTIRITKPTGVPPQPWDYRRADAGEKRGAELIVESVTLAPSQSVGASKRGGRNIIPITGGVLKGRLNGTVVPGGADYQNLANPATIDARYLWEVDGEIIVVRNGGAFGSLVPTFEVRVDSKYAWLNTGRYLSSNPGMAAGGVALTFYESTK